MNKDRRNKLYDSAYQIDEVIDSIRDVVDEEQDAYDRLPDSFQDSARGDAMLAAIDLMESYISALEEIQARILNFGKQ